MTILILEQAEVIPACQWTWPLLTSQNLLLWRVVPENRERIYPPLSSLVVNGVFSSISLHLNLQRNANKLRESLPDASRARKIRCDSTRPVCNNCARRSNECQYDAAPKRRGPDKRPGTRQRSCKKRPVDGSAPPPSKRKRTTGDRHSDARDSASSEAKEIMSRAKRSPSSMSRRIHPSGQDVHGSPSPTDLRISTEQALPLKVMLL